MLQLKKLFQDYIFAFKQYDLAAVQLCYHLPCSLHTPDKIAYLDNSLKFEKEFNEIFTVLKQANTQKIIATKASFNRLENNTVDVCIDWAFIDGKGEVFTDFCAFYHVQEFDSEYKIVSVVSHQLTNSITLPIDLVLTK